MALVITDEVLQKTNLSEKELLTDIACYLYEKKKLSMGKAKELAGLNQLQFQAALAEREIDIHYSITDLQQDLDNLKIELDIYSHASSNSTTKSKAPLNNTPRQR